MHKPFPIDLPPGIVKTDSEYSLEGRYVDGDKVRFVRGRPEKIGGWQTWSYQQFAGICRALFPWADNSNNTYLAVGTHCKLYVAQLQPTEQPASVEVGWGKGTWGSGGWGSAKTQAPAITADLTDITPYRDTGTLTNPFTTTFGSKTVNVADTGHGLSVGDTANFLNADEVAEITIDGDYLVQSVSNADSYTIEHTFAATETATGGGTVDYSYEISCGEIHTILGQGYGIGKYGVETYGTARMLNSFLQLPQFWSLDNYGKDLVALPSGGRPYLWDSFVGGRASVIANSPGNNFAAFVTDERFLMLLGAGGSPMKVQWPDQNDITEWTPSATNTANSRILQEGSKLLAGAALANLFSLVWSDTALYTFQYRGTNLIYESKVAGKECGLIGLKAFAIADKKAFWLGQDTFHYYAGSVGDIPNVEDIKEWVNRNITTSQKIKSWAIFIPRFNEVWWIFPAVLSTEPNWYVAVNIEKFHWTKGTLDRTAGAMLNIQDNRPLMASTDGYVYIHETGNDADTSALEAFIETAPFDLGDGQVNMDIWGFIPNLKRHTGDLTLRVETLDWPDDDTVLDSETATLTTTTSIADLRLSGRQAKYRITSNALGGDFRMGKPRIEISPTGGTRR